ncbi:2-oxo acid dehydrogenase subunit E2 [Limosilactobacillus mucosae]
MSKYEFKMPELGEGMAEGTIGEWHVKVGDDVAKDADMVEIENDKSTSEIPSPVDGKVTKINFEKGDDVKVGQVLIEFEVADGQGNVDESTAPAAKPASAAPAGGAEIYQFKMPELGEGMAEGTIGEWHVKVGDTIAKDADMVEIENDKSTSEIPSPVDGTVTKINFEKGDDVKVGQVLVELQVAAGQGNVEGDAAPAPAQEPAPAKATPVATAPAPAAADHSLPVLAMPAVRRYAREKGAELTKIAGTGRHGQILKADVDAFLAGGAKAALAASVASAAAAASETPKAKPAAAVSVEQPALPKATPAWPEHEEKMTPVRRATAKAMIRSVQQAPMITVFEDVVVDKLWDHRKKYKELAKDHGVHLTFMAYMTKALAVILKEFPIFNSMVDMADEKIVYRDYINVGIATDTDRGLFVPNIKHADSMSLFDIAKQISANTAKAKDGKLSGDDMSHTSMSITNIGSIGGGFFTPIVNWPEVAILGMGKIVQEPVVEDGEIKVARVLKLSLTCDHRVIDGGTAQRAMNRLHELLSDPELLLMEG